MDAEEESELYQQAFELFVEGFSNRDILGISKKFTPKGIVKILQTEIDLVLDELETTVAARHPFAKDQLYEKRRTLVIRELSEDHRLVFSGGDANTLGEANVRQFLQVCKHYLRESSLKNCPFENLYKIFRKWLLPGKERSNKDVDRKDGYIELEKKKRQMQALRIQHEILLKKSKMLQLEAEIESLKENLRRKSESKLKTEEQSESEPGPIRSESKSIVPQVKLIPSKPIIKRPLPSNIVQGLKPILKAPKTEQSPISQPKHPQIKGEALKNGQVKKNIIDKVLSNLKKGNLGNSRSKSSQNKEEPPAKRPSQLSIAQGQTRESQGGLNWRKEENEYFVKLLNVYSIRDQTNLQSEMVKKFGRRDRFTIHNIRDKKFEMFRECRRRFLLALKNRKLMNEKHYSQLVQHFETMDNRCAYDFQSKFMSEYYLCNMEEIPDRAMRDIVDAVFKQKTRVLTAKYMKKKKMDKEIIDSKQANITSEKVPTARKTVQKKLDVKMEEEDPSEGELSSEQKSSKKEEDKDSLDLNGTVGDVKLDCKTGFRQQQQLS